MTVSGLCLSDCFACLGLSPYLPVAAVVALSADCQLRQTKYGSVCVCNSNHCDYLEQPILNDNSQIVVISSSKVSGYNILHTYICTYICICTNLHMYKISPQRIIFFCIEWIAI